MPIRSSDEISESELTALEHHRGDGKKMYADTHLYRLTTSSENSDAENQRRPGTLRGQAAAFIAQAGGTIQGRILHHHMLTQANSGKWDYGYVHMVSNKNLVKRGASRDWIRRTDADYPIRPIEHDAQSTATMSPPTEAPAASASIFLQRLTLSSVQIETRQNPKLLAYRAAEQQGARFVALQNDEHLWLWDRARGRTYDDQFVGRFAEAQVKGVLNQVNRDDPSASVAVLPVEFGAGAETTLDEYLVLFSDLIRGIGLLRLDAQHVERAHERLVDHFLIQLGFDPYSEIGFRNGRIDMTIYLEGRACLAFEVKRNWRLDEVGVLDQAYNYSLEHGIRFFAISNGDDYVVHDCWRSLSREQNELHRMKVSALTLRDVAFLDWLRTRQFAD
jgi:hypothetical protein